MKVRLKTPPAQSEESKWLNMVFSTSHTAAQVRLVSIIAILVVTWGFLVVIEQTCPACDVIIFNLQNPALDFSTKLTNLLILGWETIKLFFSAKILQHILALVFPIWLASRIAAIYLDDIFELHDTRLANLYVTRSAFAFPDFQTVHIQEGNFAREDQKSTALKIGGPAFVQVHLDNAAVFEHPDGRVEVVGPTVARSYFMPGFTRLRQAVDLRPQSIPLDKVTGRTKDGIPIQLRNIRLLFSIQRDGSESSLKHPFPFSEPAILALVYGQPASGSTASVLSKTVVGLVTGQLIQFISQYTLGELLSSIGEPEIRRQIELLESLQIYMARLRQRKSRTFRKGCFSLSHKKPKAAKFENGKARPRRIIFHRPVKSEPSQFIPRSRLSSQFYATFASSFQQKAGQRGIHLEWIDVGTWSHEIDVLTSQHREALRLNNESIALGHKRVLETLQSQQRLGHLVGLNNLHPILTFGSLFSQSRNKPRIILLLLKDYAGVLKNAAEEIVESGRPIPERLANSLEILNQSITGEDHMHYVTPEER